MKNEKGRRKGGSMKSLERIQEKEKRRKLKRDEVEKGEKEGKGRCEVDKQV